MSFVVNLLVFTIKKMNKLTQICPKCGFNLKILTNEEFSIYFNYYQRKGHIRPVYTRRINGLPFARPRQNILDRLILVADEVCYYSVFCERCLCNSKIKIINWKNAFLAGTKDYYRKPPRFMYRIRNNGKN